MDNPIIGIDLGTTNSVASMLVDKLPVTILIDHAKLLPSAISLTDNGFIVGQTAKNILILEPEKTVMSIKRKIGQDITLTVGDKKMKPEEITAVILKKIRDAAIDHLKLDPKEPLRVVITVPAYFTEEQRSATKQAAELADLQVERIINEPTAAALAYGMSSLDEAIYAIYDFGGGTFDVSIVESNDGLVEVLATQGDNQLGGDDLDRLLMEHIWEKFKSINKLSNINWSQKEEARLWRIAEQTKIKLSSEAEVAIQESFFLKHKDLNLHLDLTVKRADFEKLIEKHIEKTIALLQETIKDAKLRNTEIDGIVLVGGSSRIPMIKASIEEKLNIDASLIDLPDEAVSHGATIQGAIIDKKEVDTVLIDITPHSLGVAVVDELFELKMMERIMQFGKPDLDDKDKNLGTGVLIKKNSPIPVRKTELFSSSGPFQKAYEIKVFQGEDNRYGNNKEIGVSLLKVKEPVEHGEVEVSFDLDINGILKLSAKEINTGEIISAEFQGSKARKIQKSKLKQDSDLSVVSQEAENTILTRAKDLLQKEALSYEDKCDLEELVLKYEQHEQAQEHDAIKATETELLDLLYFLESNEN